SDGTTGIKLSPLELLEKLAALVPLPRAHLVRYGGCLAPHSKLRAVIIWTPAPAGCGQRGNEDWNPCLELGKATRPCLRFGYGDLSVLPPWLTAHHCCHHLGCGHHPYPASSQAGVSPTSHCPCPLSPRPRRVRRSPHQ